jgi:hypothetical protein
MTDLEKLEEATKIQCSDGNWNWDHYMHGMANGMIFALACLKGEEPQYLQAPDEWLCDSGVAQEPKTVDGPDFFGPAAEAR